MGSKSRNYHIDSNQILLHIAGIAHRGRSLPCTIGLSMVAGSPSLSERAALHVVMSSSPPRSASPRSATAAAVDPVYAVLASADLAVILAVSLGAVLVAIAVIVALVFLASRRRRQARLQLFHRRAKESGGAPPPAELGRPVTAFTRSWASQPGIAMNDGAPVLANGGQHHLLQRATSSASGRQINVAFAPDVNIELEVMTGIEQVNCREQTSPTVQRSSVVSVCPSQPCQVH